MAEENQASSQGSLGSLQSLSDCGCGVWEARLGLEGFLEGVGQPFREAWRNRPRG